MVIAINTRILSGDTAAAKLLAGYFINIAADNPSHQFYFISEKEGLHVFALNNVKTVVIKQDSPNPFRWKLWYNYKLPSALKKIKADMPIAETVYQILWEGLPAVEGFERIEKTLE